MSLEKKIEDAKEECKEKRDEYDEDVEIEQLMNLSAIVGCVNIKYSKEIKIKSFNEEYNHDPTVINCIKNTHYIYMKVHNNKVDYDINILYNYILIQHWNDIIKSICEKYKLKKTVSGTRPEINGIINSEMVAWTYVAIILTEVRPIIGVNSEMIEFILVSSFLKIYYDNVTFLDSYNIIWYVIYLVDEISKFKDNFLANGVGKLETDIYKHNVQKFIIILFSNIKYIEDNNNVNIRIFFNKKTQLFFEKILEDYKDKFDNDINEKIKNINKIDDDCIFKYADNLLEGEFAKNFDDVMLLYCNKILSADDMKKIKCGKDEYFVRKYETEIKTHCKKLLREKCMWNYDAENEK
jgi:hypothetical protein